MASVDNKLSDEGQQLAGKLLSETREELIRADSKAQVLFAATGVVISVVAGGIISGDWGPGQLSCTAKTIWWIGVAAAAFGEGALGFALWPRIGAATTGRARYYADFRHGLSISALTSTLETEAAREDRDVEQLLAIASIVWAKYTAIRVAIIALASAVALAAIALAIG